MISDFFLIGLVTTYLLKSSVVVRRHLNRFPGVIGLIGPIKPTWILSRGLVVQIFGSFFCWFLAGDFVTLPFSQALQRGLISNFGHFGRRFKVSKEICPYLS
jgi:hypothetical protein